MLATNQYENHGWQWYVALSIISTGKCNANNDHQLPFMHQWRQPTQGRSIQIINPHLLTVKRLQMVNHLQLHPLTNGDQSFQTLQNSASALQLWSCGWFFGILWVLIPSLCPSRLVHRARALALRIVSSFSSCVAKPRFSMAWSWATRQSEGLMTVI